MNSKNLKLPEPKYETWTPEDAQKAFDTQKTNRDLSQARVDQYARDMAEGRWNGVTTIYFNTKGHLVDGQHRAMAQVKSDTTQSWIVLRGVPDDWQKTMDNGYTRNVGQQLKMTEGVDQSLAMLTVAVARNVYRTVHEKWGAAQAISTAEVWETLEKHPDLRISAEIALNNKQRSMTPIPPNVMGIAHWMIMQANGQEIADWFIEKVVTMEGESSATVIGALSRRCNELKRQRVRVPHRDYLLMMIRAWNLVAEGKHQKRIYQKTKLKNFVLPQAKRVKVGVNLLDAA